METPVQPDRQDEDAVEPLTPERQDDEEPVEPEEGGEMGG